MHNVCVWQGIRQLEAIFFKGIQLQIKQKRTNYCMIFFMFIMVIVAYFSSGFSGNYKLVVVRCPPGYLELVSTPTT